MDSDTIMGRLSLRSKFHRLPLAVTVEVTTRCNERCEHCYIADHERQELATEELYDLFRDLKESGTFYLTLTGGEFFVRKDCREIVTEARRLRMSVTIFTNATLIDQKVAEWLVSIGVHEVGVSLYSMDPDVHDSITNLKGSWGKTTRGIQYLRNAGMPVIIKCPIMRANVNSYEEVLAFAEKIGAETQMSPSITVCDDGSNHQAGLRLTSVDLDRVISDPRVVEQSETPTHFEDSLSTVPCTAIFNGGAVDSRGFVYPCNQYLLPLGNIKEQKFSEIWNTSDVLSKLRAQRVADLAECSGCHLFAYCTRCPGSAYLEDGDLLGCSQVAKEIAESRKRCGVYPAASTIFAPKE